MRILTAFLAVLAVLLMSAAAAQARIAYADSDLFAIDTLTSAGDTAGGLPLATRIASVYPNPFNPSTTIALDLAADGPVKLEIFDVRGRLVKIVGSGTMAAGRHHLVWDGTGRDGRGVPSGTYFCRLVAGQTTQTMKLLLAK